jgi:hypothetical protein
MIKVFGVGACHTGTKSLAEALRILGFHTLHFCPITHSFPFPGFQNYEAVVSPSLVYEARTLTSWYPGAKYILTSRDYDEWTKAMGSAWEKVLPIDDHNAFILKYIKHPLVIDITKGVAWDTLCNFLDVELPQNIKFPHIQ